METNTLRIVLRVALLALCLCAVTAQATNYVVARSVQFEDIAYDTNLKRLFHLDTYAKDLKLWVPIYADKGTNFPGVSFNQNNTFAPAGGNKPAFSNASSGFAWFDGVNDVISIADRSNLRPGSADWTVACWTRKDIASDYRRLVEKGDSNIRGGWWLRWMPGNKFHLMTRDWSYDDSGVTSQTALAVGNWYHVVATRYGATMSIYVDGILDHSQGGTTIRACTNSAEMRLGNSANYANQAHKGGIADVMCWKSTQLTSTQISNLWTDTVHDYYVFWNVADPNYRNLKLWHPINAEPSTTNFWVRDYGILNPTGGLTDANVGSQIIAANQPAYSNAFSGFLQYDGINDYLKIPDDGSLPETGDFTLTAWVRPTGTNTQNNIMTKRFASNTNVPWLVLVDDRNASGYTNAVNGVVGGGAGSTLVSANDAAPDDVWTFVAMRMSGTNLTMWINGTNSASDGFAGSRQSNTNAILIGARRQGVTLAEGFFKGGITQAKIYDTALTDAEMLDLFSLTKGIYKP